MQGRASAALGHAPDLVGAGQSLVYPRLCDPIPEIWTGFTWSEPARTSHQPRERREVGKPRIYWHSMVVRGWVRGGRVGINVWSGGGAGAGRR
jgi:hypothetical protein